MKTALRLYVIVIATLVSVVFSMNNAVAQITGASSIIAGTTTTYTAPATAITGGTLTTVGGYNIHSFTSNGSFVMPSGFTINAELLVVAGGGGGGYRHAGGGGAGGLIYNASTSINATQSITIGGGGAGSTNGSVNGANGGNTVFGSLTAIGGGGGGSNNIQGNNGGSGGGGSNGSFGGVGTAGQGFAGGNQNNGLGCCFPYGNGGGGATAAGASTAANLGSAGGAGFTTSISGVSASYAGGGGGGNNEIATIYPGGIGGGGAGANATNMTGGNATPNTGGGGGGGGANGSNSGNGGAGASGIVIVKYAQPSAGVWASSNTAVATVNPSTGVVTGVSAGTANITYTVTVGGVNNVTTKQVTVTTPATALNFDGTNDYISLNNTIGNFGTGDFTIQMRIKTTVHFEYLLSKRSICGADNMLSMQLVSGRLSVETASDGGANYAGLTGNIIINDGNWHHIAAVRKSGVLYLYIDGIADGSAPSLGNINNSYTTTLGTSICVGQNSSVPFQGSMDELSFWSRGLCQAEIQNNMSCSLSNTGQNGLLALYHFDNGAVGQDNSAIPGIATLTDASGNGNNGTLVNFGYTGSTSNYVAGATSGTCTAFTAAIPVLSGAANICVGSNTTLTSSISGGVWTTSNASVASINASTGDVAAIASGTVIFTYTTDCGAVATKSVTVKALPTVNISAGSSTSFCAGGSVNLTASGSAIDLNGTNQYIGMSAGYPATSNLTYEAWVYPKALAANNFNVVLNHAGWAAGYVHFQFANGVLGFSVNGNSPTDYTSTFAFTPNNWYHIAAVYSQSAKTVKMYVNGNLINTYSYATAVSVTGNIPFKIGAWDGQRFFNGTIDEVRIWNTARTDAEILNNMNASIAANSPGLVGYYRMDERTGTTTADASGSNPGTLVNGATWVNSAPALSNTYLWSNGLTTQTINATTAGSYSVTATNTSGCSINSTATVVTVNPLPTATITADGPTTFCTGGSVTLTASAGTGYLWSNGATTQAITTSTAGSYTVTVTNASGCSAVSSPTVITVNSLPVANITAGGSTTFCQGGSVSLTVSSGNALTFNGTNRVTVSSTPTLPVGNSAYTIEAWVKPKTISGVNGIIGWGNWGAVNQTNAIRFNGPTTIINYWWSNDLYVTVPNVLDGKWHHIAATFNGTTRAIYMDGVLMGSDVPTGHNVPSGTTMYIAETNPVSNEYFDGSVDEVRIWNVGKTQAQITASMNASVPVNSTGLVAYYKLDEGSGVSTTDATGNANNGTLTGSPVWMVPSTAPVAGVFQSVSWSPGGATTASINATTSGSYTATVTNAAGCSVTLSPIVVTVNPLPTATITANGPTTFCAGGSVILTASAGSSYLWSNGATTQAITTSAAGSYTVTVTNASGCSAVSTPTTVTVTPATTATLTSVTGSNIQTVCLTAPIGNITYSTIGATGITATGLPAGVTAVFAGNNITVSGTPTAVGTFNYSISSVGGTCGAFTVTGTITVRQNSVLPSSVSANVTSICQGKSVILSQTGGLLGNGGSWKWYSDAAFTTLVGTSTLANAALSVTPANTTTYYLRIEGVTSPCSPAIVAVPLSVTVNVGPAATTPTTSNVVNCSNGIVSLTASGGSNPNYLWFDALTGGNLLATTATFTTQALTQTTSYYVSDYTAGNETSSNAATGSNQFCSFTTGNSATSFDITNTSGNNLLVTGLSTSFHATNATQPVQVYYRTSTYSGNDGNPAGWVLVFNGNINVSATRTPIKITLTTPVYLPAGSKYGFYIYTPGISQRTSAGAGTFAGPEITITTGNLTCAASSPFLGGGINAAQSLFGSAYYKNLSCESPRTIAQAIITTPNTISLTSAAGTNAQNICFNAPVSTITYATTGATGATVSGLPTGVTGVWSGNVVTISGTPSVTGVFNYTITLTGGCGNTTATGTITVNTNVIPTFTQVAPICSGATLAALPTTSNNGITGTWSPALNNTATTTYTFTPTVGQCATTATMTIVVNPLPTATSAKVDVVCSGTNTGSITVTPISGTAPYQYSIDGGITYQSGNTFSGLAVGNYSVYIKDANTCSNAVGTVNIIQNDNILPTITAPNAVTVVLGNGNCTASGVDLGTPVTADNCGVASVTNNAPAVYPLGNTIVTWTVTDNSNNTQTATQIVTVVAPEINITGNNVSIVKGDISASTADNTDFGGTLPGVPVSKTFTIQNTGTNSLTVSSIDISGLNASDFTLSGMVFPATIAANTNATFTVVFNSSSAGVKNATVTVNNSDCDEASYDFAVKATITCTTPVITNNSPYLQAFSNATTCNAVVNYSISVSGVPAPSVSYAFTGATVAAGTGTGSGELFNTGITHVVVTASNPCGTVTNQFDMTVVDNVKPNAITKNITVYLNASGQAVVTPQDINNGSYDNCGAVTLSLKNKGTICAVATEGSNINLSAPAGTVITAIDFASYGNPTGSCGNFTQNWCHATNSKSVVEAAALGKNSVSIAASNSVFGDPCYGTQKRLAVQATYEGGSSQTNIFNCNSLGDHTVTLIVTDANGNTSTATAIVTVKDNIAPTITAPANITVNTDYNSCTKYSGNISLGSPVTTDNCTVSVSNNAPQYFPIGTTVVTWTVTDASGNIATATQNVTVVDKQGPIVNQGTIYVNADPVTCKATVTYDVSSFTSDCTPGPINITYSIASGSEFSIGFNPVLVTATDVLGNVTNMSFGVVVRDVTPPVITVPADITVNNDPGQCGAVVNFEARVKDCSGVSVSYSVQPGSFFSIGTKSITVNAVDNWGNSSTAVFNVTVVDHEPPIITNVPANITTTSGRDSCGTVVYYAAPTASENCATQSQIFNYTGKQESFTVPTGVTSIRVNVAGASGGNAANGDDYDAAGGLGGSVSATIPVTPGQVLYLNVGGMGKTAVDGYSGTGGYNGGGNGKSADYYYYNGGGGGGASDIRSGSGYLSDRMVVAGGGGGGGYGPLGGNGGGLIGESAGGWYGNGGQGGTQDTGGYGDYYSGAFGIGGDGIDYSPSGGGGGGWFGGGGGGNWSSGGGGSSFTFVAATNVNHLQGVNSGDGFITLTWTVPNAIVQTTGLPSGSVFPVGTTINTFVATDNAGNSSTARFTVIVKDNQFPTLIGVPANTTVECDAIPAVANVTATDNCSTSIPTFTESRTDGTCANNYIVTRTWSTTDASGNTTTGKQIIMVQDTKAPVLTVPAEISVNNDNSSCGAIVNFAATATDNCGTVSITYSQNPGTLFAIGSTVVTATAIDACGNAISKQFTVTVTDNQPPVLIGVPANVTVECDAVPKAAVVTATDNCSTSVPTYTETRTDGDCPSRYTLTRAWSTTDASGNTTTATQVITVQDTKAPILTEAPADVTVECDAVPAAAVLTATDNCSTARVSYTEVRTDGNCSSNYTLTRTWTAVDACGNASSKTQVITVQDTKAPILSEAPADITVECDAVPTAMVLTATDNCSTPVVTYTETRTNGNYARNYTLTRVWTAVDACGNTSSKTQVITVRDTQAPVPNVAILPIINAECSANVVAPLATDNCGGLITGTTTNPTNYNTQGTYTITWVYDDGNGNISTQNQQVIIKDITKPILTIPANITVVCSAPTTPASTGLATATDNCVAPVQISYSDAIDVNQITRIWTATDLGGNSVSANQVITILPLSVTIASVPTSSVYTGGSPTNLYIGYGAQSLYVKGFGVAPVRKSAVKKNFAKK